MSKILKNFRDFIQRGNVLDLAVGVILGASFGSITKSLVDDVLMPPIGLLLGNVDFGNLFIVLKSGPTLQGPYVSLAAAKQAGAVTLNVGLFLNTIVNFLIVAFAIYLLLKLLRRQERAAEPQAPAPTCPYCLETVALRATRCPHCTSELVPQALDTGSAPTPSNAR